MSVNRRELDFDGMRVFERKVRQHNDTSGGDSANGNRDYDHFYPGAGEPPLKGTAWQVIRPIFRFNLFARKYLA